MVLVSKKKKNLRRQTESKTGEFKFIICGNNILVYPVLLKIEDVIIANYSLNLKITSLQQTRTGKNIATHFTPHTNIIKIHGCQVQMIFVCLTLKTHSPEVFDNTV